VNRYEQRCNDPAERSRWLNSGLVRIDTLRKGDVFESIDGDYWQVQHTTRSDTVFCEPWGHAADPTTFIQHAMVRPVMTKTYVQPETSK
jgi:hypothetical protein